MEAMQRTSAQIFDEKKQLAEFHPLNIPDTQPRHITPAQRSWLVTFGHLVGLPDQPWLGCRRYG